MSTLRLWHAPTDSSLYKPNHPTQKTHTRSTHHLYLQHKLYIHGETTPRFAPCPCCCGDNVGRGLRRGPGGHDPGVQEVRDVPSGAQDPAVGSVLRCVAEGGHPVPLQKGHQRGREGVVHGEGPLRLQLLQEALQAWVQVRE